VENQLETILYILSNARQTDLLPPTSRSTGKQASAVLIQDAVGLPDVSAEPVYALADDVATREVIPSYPLISYPDLLRLIFEVDKVVVL